MSQIPQCGGRVVHPIWHPGLGMGGQIQDVKGCLHLPGRGMDGQVQWGLVLVRLLEVLLLVLIASFQAGRDEEGRCSVNEFLLLNHIFISEAIIHLAPRRLLSIPPTSIIDLNLKILQ